LARYSGDFLSDATPVTPISNILLLIVGVSIVACITSLSLSTIALDAPLGKKMAVQVVMHCPKCQGAAAREWMAARAAELLPVPYFHIVFTLPAAIGDIAYQNKAVIYDLLFRASAETMLTFAARSTIVSAQARPRFLHL
jgi:hypothetical protein